MSTHRDKPMACTTARRLMSEALDQRLARDTAHGFRQHLLACQSCRCVFDDLRLLKQATQELPSQPPSADFQTRLFERIESGEGTLVDVLRGPTPLAHRVRFFASGAATAAALLLSAWLIFDGLKDETPTGAIPSEVAKVETVDPVQLGRETLVRTSNLLRQARHEAPRLVRQPPLKARERLSHLTQDVLGGIHVIHALEKNNLELPQRFREPLGRVEFNMRRVRDIARRQRFSRDDLQHMVKLVLAEDLDLEAAKQARIGMLDDVDLGRSINLRDRERVQRIMRFFERNFEGVRLVEMQEVERGLREQLEMHKARVRFGGSHVLLRFEIRGR